MMKMKGEKDEQQSKLKGEICFIPAETSRVWWERGRDKAAARRGGGVLEEKTAEV